MIQIIRSRLKPHRYKLTFALFLAPLLALLAVLIGWAGVLVYVVFLSMFVGYVFLLDCFRQWLESGK